MNKGKLNTDNLKQPTKLLDLMDVSLDTLDLKYQTDKASSDHNYLVHYAELLTHLRLQHFDMLERGFFNGASIRMWHEYYPAATIVGVDVEQINFDIADLPRFTFVPGNQADPVFLHKLPQQFNFRLVADDAGHYWAHQIFTFQTMFPVLAPGSLSICEDSQTSFGGYADHFQGGAKESAAAYILRLARLVAAAEQEPVLDTDDPLMHAIAKKVRGIMFIRHCAILRC